MKRLASLLFFAGLIVVTTAAPADTKTRAACSHECNSCKARCHDAPDKAACERTCFEMKRSCCTSCGAGPGPKTTCSCT